MNTLAPLKLHGVGTPQVESLLSYAIRLSHVHSVSPTQMLGFVESQIETGGPRGGRRLEANASTFAAYSNTTLRIVGQLEMLTGVSDLDVGTYLALRSVLTNRCSDVVVARRRWCPECYFCPDPIEYEPLYWLSPYVKRCQIHMTPFVDCCAHCGLPQSHVRPLEVRNRCASCRRNLTRADRTSPFQFTPWDAWAEVSALELIKHCGTVGRIPIHPQAMDEFSSTLRMFGARNYPHLGNMTNVVYGRTPGQKAALGSFFSLAALQSCSPLSMMMNPRAAGSPVVDLGNPGIRPPERNLERNARAAPVLEQLIKDQLDRDPSVSLLPLGALIRAAGISNPGFQRRSVHALTSAYGAVRRRRELDAKFAAVQRALQVAVGLVREGGATDSLVSQRLLVCQVKEKAMVPKHIAIGAVSSVINEQLSASTRSLTPTKAQRAAMAARVTQPIEGVDDAASECGAGHGLVDRMMLLAADMQAASTDGLVSDPNQIADWGRSLWRCHLDLLDLFRICGEFVDLYKTDVRIARLRSSLSRVSGRREPVERLDPTADAARVPNQSPPSKPSRSRRSA